MLGLGGFPSIWPLQDHKRPPGFRGLLSATDPLLPDDIFMGNVGLPITKLTYTVTWAPAAARPFRPLGFAPPMAAMDASPVVAQEAIAWHSSLSLHRTSFYSS